jgi:hypothetical protein
MDMILYDSLTKSIVIQASTTWATDFLICTKTDSDKSHELFNTIQVGSTKWQTIIYPASIHFFLTNAGGMLELKIWTLTDQKGTKAKNCGWGKLTLHKIWPQACEALQICLKPTQRLQRCCR